MDNAEREALRLRLLSHDVHYVMGYASGAGDSSDEYYVSLARDGVSRGYTAERYQFTGERKSPYGGMTRYHDAPFIRLRDPSGTVLRDEPAYTFSVDTRVQEVVEHLDGLDKLDWAMMAKVENTEVPAELRQEVNDLMDEVVDGVPSWDFNNDGSTGAFFWDLRKNIARVSGYYNVSDTVDFGDEDPLEIGDEEVDASV